MGAPKTCESLLAWLLLILGGVFTLLGLAAYAVSIPTRGGDARDFLLAGLPLLLFGAGLLLYAWRKEQLWDRLKREGTAVPGELVPKATRCHRYVSFGSGGLRKRHPWSVTCTYRWEGKIYFVRSQFLWQKPRETEQRSTVYIDPRRPARAWVDPDTIRTER